MIEAQKNKIENYQKLISRKLRFAKALRPLKRWY